MSQGPRAGGNGGASLGPKIGTMLMPTRCESEFHCTLCGATLPVEFSDPEAYDEADPLPNKNQWVRDQALLAANARLQKRAQAAMQVVVCPSCHRRDARAVRRSLVRSMLPLVGLLPGLFMAGVIATALLFPALSRAKHIIPVLVGSSIVVVATPIVAWRRQKRVLAESDRAVRFLPSG